MRDSGPNSRSTRMRWFVGGCALVLATLTVPTAQTPAAPARPLTPVGQAERALNEGRYDEVDAILKNEQSPRVPALRAQAAIARGRYADAEAVLKAPAAAAPTGDAALQLGLLQMLRRPAGRRTAHAAPRGRRRRAAHRGRLRADGDGRPRAGRIQGRQRSLPQRHPPRARRSGDQHRLGRAVPREVRPSGGVEVVPGGAEGRRHLRAGAARPGDGGGGRQPARGQGSHR